LSISAPGTGISWLSFGFTFLRCWDLRGSW
jgi:hypothetical protein